MRVNNRGWDRNPREPMAFWSIGWWLVPLSLGAGPIVVDSTPPPQLTRSDLEAWLDGYLPGALLRNDMAGAVVVVVRGGQVLLAKGYGYADVAARRPVDPDRTGWPLASITKTFTATAVMQLVELGKLDLDRDVDSYLDFSIPPEIGSAHV